jgi:uncharacterized membrane protein YeaQ/YmgE (transglycosylase-associated protein family)
VDINGLWSGLLAAAVIGVLARLMTRTAAPLGCFITLAVGLVGAGLGLALGEALDWGFWLTFASQIVIAALIVVPFSLITRPRARPLPPPPPPPGTGPTYYS